MSEEASSATPTTTQGSAQQAPTPPATTPAAAQVATAPPKPAAAPIGITSEQLKDRLDEERVKTTDRVRAELLKELGMTDTASAKAKLEALAKLEAEKLSELERRDKEIADLKPKADRVSAIEKQFADVVEEQFKALPKDVQKAIDASANGNAEERMKMMRVYRAMPQAAAAAVETEPVKPLPIQPGATTAPVSAAPAAATPITQNHLAEHERLLTVNPFAAARYYAEFKPAILAAKRARTA